MSEAKECEEYLDRLRGTMSEGQRAFEALETYRAHGLPPPAWALDEISACYRDFKEHCRPEGWTAVEGRQAAPRTLDDAFGVKPHKRMHTDTARTKALLRPRVLAIFRGPNPPPRSEDGYREVGERLGLKVDEVREWLRAADRDSRGD